MAGYIVLAPEGIDLPNADAVLGDPNNPGTTTHYALNAEVPLSRLIPGQYQWLVQQGILDPAGSGFGGGENLLHNGAFNVWQRGTSTTTTSAVTSYGPDRWHVYSGTTGRTVSVQTGTDEIRACVRYQRDSGNSNTNVNYLGQNIETVNSRHLSGKAVTISFWARAGANYSSASNGLSVQVRSGTGTDESMFTGFTGNNNFINQTATLTTTWTKYEYTGTVPAGTTQLGAIFYYTPVGTASTNDYFEVTGVQLEQGSAATPYKHKDYGQELAECQRYYYRSEGTFGTGQCSGTTGGYVFVRFPVQMRTLAALSTTGTASDYKVWAANTSPVTCSAVPTDFNENEQGSCIAFTVASGLVAGNATGLWSDTGGYLGFSADL